ncbi:MAG TPA: universal stress protein [Desulfobacteraceae bacterium]|nr:universal stress protein [Desulfobacteraceae bacterium]
MENRLLHIFRNTPLGRETFLQSIYFCSQIGLSLTVYIPLSTKFLMYFENDVVQVDLDNSYLTGPETAEAHARQLIEAAGLRAKFLTPKYFTASTLPDIPTDFDFMCCPRTISDLSSKVGLGYIGPRVRRIVGAARYPVLIPSVAYKPWQSVIVFFGGSSNAVKAFRLGLAISRRSGLPLDLYTQAEGRSRADYREGIEAAGLGQALEESVRHWYFFESGGLEENLYNVPHDALGVVGAFGHGLIRDLLFGSKMEEIQSILPNSLLIVGPKYSARF